ncbi:pyocin knob domain-containing protein [Serratia nevei]|uniref:pyocin knob domain-containing protein n=1 Tax=Serratia nevei TaxID=2703794 RepID=UPI00254EDB4A|nr:pyocin knob domain-containing protein [Serratia nevei]MEC5810920.1 pyocin knob domain-containing protein [Serratia nevei]MEC5845216.1 pyocin knob domain-containing protein [Serratia nevei]MEC5898847.1 pyocin knob domain-containing protein [Serratia nevei]MEC5951048.1 pyocin knob domain-containing protein [Serratia nevei]
MIIGFGNNVVSSLAADITATQTTIQVMPGAGALFSGLLTYDYANDSNPLKVYAKITLTDAKETVFEVCHLTAVNNDMLTVVRGQEGTAAKGWSLNDVIANFATRGSENQFVQIEQLQSGHYTSAVAGGTANGLTLALPATFFLNGSTEWALKTPILIYPTLNNTGASTLQLTMGGRVMGTYPLVKGSNTALRAGDIVAKNPFLAVFNADQGRFIVLNPTTDVGSVRTVNSIGPDVAGNVKLKATDVGALPVYPDTLSVDLNTLGATAQAGVYCQPENAGATTAKHYPVNLAGTLLVTPSAYGCQQEYTEYSAGRKFQRGLTAAWNGKDGPWSQWREYYGEGHKPTPDEINAVKKSGDTMTGPLGTPRVIFPGTQAMDGNTDIDRPDGFCIESINGNSVNYPKPVSDWLASLLTFKIGENRNVQFAVGSGRTEFYYRSIRKDTPATMKWLQLFTTEGGTISGPLTAPYVSSTPNVVPEGAGPFSNQLNSKAPLYQPNWQWPVNTGGLYVPIVKGVSTRQGQGYPTAVSFGYLLSGTPSFAQACIHAKGDNSDFNWRFDGGSGNFYCPGGVYANNAIFHVDGNITGNIWGGYLSNWLNQNISNAQNNAQNWAYQNLVQNVRLTGRINQPDTGGQVRVPDGCVFTGMSGANYDPSIWASYSYVQVLINGSWRNIGTS